jgi:TrmH family RNA methyltransferase
MGSTFRLPVVEVEQPTAVFETLDREAVTLLAAVPHGGQHMHETDMRNGVAIMLGGEGSGLAPAYLALADRSVSIPMHGGVESLNVAVAAALLVYEAQRQRAPKEVL